MTHEEWKAEAIRRFGEDPLNWKFVCPSCGFVASVRDWKEAGASDREAAFSCIGRHKQGAKDIFPKNGGPCNYAGGGLFQFNPVCVEFEGKKHMVFDFA